HDDVAEHRPADQNRFEHRLPKRAAATAVSTSDLAPCRHSVVPTAHVLTSVSLRVCPYARVPASAAGVRRAPSTATNGAPRARAQFSANMFWPCRMRPAAP